MTDIAATNKRRATINLYPTLTDHILLNSGRRDVIEPPKDRKFCEERDSRRQFDVDTSTRDVTMNRRATLIRALRVKSVLGNS